MWLDNLNRIKKNSGMTIEQISEASGVPKGTLNKLLQARQKILSYPPFPPWFTAWGILSMICLMIP